ncbi:MAG: phage tail tube protein [bacterium]
MADLFGAKSQLGVGFEATPGTKASSLISYRFDVELPLNFKIERNMIDRAIVRGSASAMKKVLGLIKVAGTVNKEMYSRQDGYFYRCLMGGIPTTTVPTDVTLLSATTIASTMSLTTQPTVANMLKLTVAGATAWGNITITGKDGLGNAITETVTFTANATKNTTKYFKSVDANGITTSGFTGGTLEIKGNKNTYEHLFTLQDAVPSVTMEVSKGGMPWTYWGLGCTSAEIKIDDVEGIAKLTFNFIGKDGEPKALDGSTTPASLNNLVKELFMNWNMQLKIDDVAIGITKLALTIDNQLRDNTAEIKDGSQVALPRLIRDNQRKISGTFNLRFEDATYYNKFIAGTPAKLELLGTNQVPAGPFENIKFELPEIVFEGTDPEVGDMGVIYNDIPFSAFSSAGTNDELKITVVSTDQNYD